MSDMNLEQKDTPLEVMQSTLEAQKRAYLAEGEVSFAARFDRLERAINVVPVSYTHLTLPTKA